MMKKNLLALTLALFASTTFAHEQSGRLREEVMEGLDISRKKAGELLSKYKSVRKALIHGNNETLS